MQMHELPNKAANLETNKSNPDKRRQQEHEVKWERTFAMLRVRETFFL
jgi:hypothetical protein